MRFITLSIFRKTTSKLNNRTYVIQIVHSMPHLQAGRRLHAILSVPTSLEKSHPGKLQVPTLNLSTLKIFSILH